MANDLSQIAKSKGIKYFLVSFVDLFGTLRAKLVPASAIKDMQKEGAGFAGFAAWFDMSPADHGGEFRLHGGAKDPELRYVEVRQQVIGDHNLTADAGGAE